MVHPHSRGENYPPAADDAVCLGSSPLARGKLMCIVCSVRRRRFIPTRAGKIVRRVSGRLCAGVHPHSRGENLELDIQTKEQEGSSPLARGKFYGGESSDYRMRFIPTRAGKMLNRPSRWLWPGVHPHSRGENQQVVACCGGCLGSSPLARGKFGSRPESISLRRFIPTRAGKISTRAEATTTLTVHPHSRGENAMWKTLGSSSGGSSPLARGKYGNPGTVTAPVRFIPTRAGKIFKSQGYASSDGVHPHSRGENA